MLTRQELIERAQKARIPKGKKPVEPIAKKSGTDDSVYTFFTELRPKMTGKCLFCTGKSEKKNDDTFHFSLAHLLPKASFPSVAIHPDNIIELCYYGESCHAQFDNGKITWEFLFDSHEWPVIKDKLLKVLPMVAANERSQKLYSKLYELIYKK